jgi:chromosome segregation ATPase
MRENHLERLFREAGKQISNTDFITTIGDPGLDEAAAPFLELMDESQRLEQEIKVLEEERSTLQSELETLGVARRPAGRLHEINDEIREAESQRAESLAAIARSAAGSELVSQLGDEIQEALEQVRTTEQQRETAQETLNRLDAALEAERLSGDVDQMESSIKRKRDQIQNLTNDIEALEREKAGLQARIEEAERKRGSVEELLR